MSNEHRFFEQLASAGQPGWDVKLQPHLKPGQMDLAQFDAFIYVVDTSTGWTAAGAMAGSGFAAAARLPADSGLSMLTVTDMAGQSITRLGREMPAADSAEVVQCIQLVASALTGTQTFKQVSATADLSGHWVYLAYRMHDASTVARPVFFRTGAAGLLPTEMLHQVACKVVAQDRQSPGSAVGQMLKRAGGPILDKSFLKH